MMMEFQALKPGNLAECLRSLAEHGEDARVLAGGTDLFVLMRSRAVAPRFVIPVAHLGELKTASDSGGAISLGAGLSHSEIAGLDVLKDIRCLTDAAGSVGSPQIRNAGTAGGNLANASPAADLYPPLFALGARLELLKEGGSRTLDIDRFVEGPGSTVLLPEELVGSVVFSRPRKPFFSAYIKIGLRNALAISVASAAMVARCEGGRFRDVRIACGAVAPTAVRMRKAEDLLNGEIPTEHLIEEAGAVAYTECDPITDIRATREYRCHVAGVIVSRLVRQASRELMAYCDE